MGNSLRRNKSSNVKDKQKVELSEFTTYITLIPELRHHALTYCSAATLLNYSQCSHHANLEIQRFNTKTPSLLEIVEENDGVVMKMFYKNQAFGRPRKIVKKFMISEKQEDVMLEVEKHLEKYFKYIYGKSASSVVIDVKQWPANLMKMKQILSSKDLEITIYKSSLYDFMEHFKNSSHKIKHLRLRDCDDVSDRVTIPAAFFKTEAFKKLEKISIYLKCEIDSEDFINLQKLFVHIQISINFDDIRAKVRNWNSTRHNEDVYFVIYLPEDDDREFDLAAIFPFDQFGVLPEPNSFEIIYKIGNVDVFRNRGCKKELFLTFKKDRV